MQRHFHDQFYFTHCIYRCEMQSTPSPNEICHLHVKTKQERITLSFVFSFSVLSERVNKKGVSSVVFTIIDGGKNHGWVHHDEALINDLSRDTENI